MAHCQDSFPFRWDKDAITYLGIQIPAHLSDLYRTNHHPALLGVQKHFKEWSGLNVSWFGRSALIKMIVLSPLLYLMQAVPLSLLTAFFATYRKACSAFLWRDSPPRIKYSRLTLPKTRGGIGLPDLHKYYIACHLTRITDWNIHAFKKSWVFLEGAFSAGLLHLPWLSSKNWPQSLSNHPLIYPSLLAYRKSRLGGISAPIPGPLTSLWGNPDFPPGDSNSFPQQEWPFEDVLLREWFARISKIKDMEELIHIAQDRMHKFSIVWRAGLTSLPLTDIASTFLS